MKTDLNIKNCDVCNSPYYYGPGRYEAHRLQLYGGIMCCNSCWRSNEDGWGPIHEPALLKHLAHKGLPEPIRNTKGWLPRE